VEESILAGALLSALALAAIIQSSRTCGIYAFAWIGVPRARSASSSQPCKTLRKEG
jgi:hypothetical protein